MHFDSGVWILTFIVLSLLFGALVKSFPKILTAPYSVILLFAGLCLGLTTRTEYVQVEHPDLVHVLSDLALVDPHLILLLFLPTLIFESAFAMETHLFKRMFSQIAILAVPGLLLTTALTGAFAYYFFPWDWSWTVCFLFGALISATDPVAVVSLLKEVSSRKRLETLIEGESLLNDGTAIVLFTLFYGMLSASGGGEFNLFNISSSFVSVVFLGLAIGASVGLLVLFWIGKLFNQPIIEITLTISAAYMSYFIAENIFHVSGVVAVVTIGVMLASAGRTRISPEVEEFLHHFWQMMAHVANTLIFILVGVIIATRIRIDMADWWVTLAGLYIGIQVIRGFSVTVFMPILKRIGIGITKEKAIVLVWGGLRGAVSLALALIIAQDTLLSKELGDQILFLTAGIVVLTIVINSSTMTTVLRYLGLDQLPPAKQASLDKAKYTIKEKLLDDLPTLQENPFLQRANWNSLTNPIHAIKKPEQQPEKKGITADDLRVAFYRRLLETERQFYWTQFKQGALTGDAVTQLVNAVEVALDGNPKISPRATLSEFWKTPSYIQFFNRIPMINRLVIYFSFERLALSYDTARGFIQAQDEIEKHVKKLAHNEEEAALALSEIEENKYNTQIHIEALRDNFPDLSYSLETHSAHRLLLNLERAYLDELIEDGVLDDSEASKLTHDIEYKLAHLKREAHRVSAKEISKQLSAMVWAIGIKHKTLLALGKLAKRQIYNSGELIYKQKQQANAVGIVMHGRVGMICLTEEEQAKVGALIGTCAFLSGHYETSAKAITPTEIVWLDIHKLKNIISKDDMLEEVFAEHLVREVLHH